MLGDHLGVDRVIWLPLGVVDDETDGHVDNFARFMAPGVVALTWTDDTSDPQYARSATRCKILESATDARGRRLEVVKLHQPGPLYVTDAEADGLDLVSGSRPRRGGDRLAGSYVNCYLGDGIVVLPLFDDAHDDAAVETCARSSRTAGSSGCRVARSSSAAATSTASPSRSPPSSPFSPPRPRLGTD